MRRASDLEPRLEVPQLGVLRLHLVADARDLLRVALTLCAGVAPAQVPEQVLFQTQVGLELLVPRRDLGLRFQLLELRAELEADIGDA